MISFLKLLQCGKSVTQGKHSSSVSETIASEPGKSFQAFCSYSILRSSRERPFNMHRALGPFRRRWFSLTRIALRCSLLLLCSVALADQSWQSPELLRPIRSWEFLSAVGTRAGIFGNEQGTLEAWVYPLKILRNFHLRFHIGGATLPAEVLAQTLIVHPESSAIVYTGDVFSVRETLFVPVHESGAIIAFEVDTAEPLEIEAIFDRDFQLEWPASIGGVDEEWDSTLRAFRFGEESGKFNALVGSPSAIKRSEEYSTNYFSSHQDSILLGATRKGSETKLIVIAAGFEGPAPLARLYEHLAKDYPELLRSSAAYYRDYLDRTVSLKLPDPQIETAYDWAKVSMLQGVVQNPFLGEGLVAGFNTSDDNHRPGFAWFFGRDAEWTSLALDAEGDFPTVRDALEFLSKYQRADGKMPHEVSQSASFTDWFKSTPYAYASADATPLYLIAVNDYVTHSGDIGFAQQKWDSLWRAYGFLRSTYDAQGLAQNLGVGTGWIEGGPLYPVRTELYQASLGLEAARALSHLAHLLGKEDLAKDLEQTFERQKPLLDKTFWSAEKRIYAYALDTNDKRVDVASVLATVPMWFKQLNGDQARSMIEELARPDHQTDWGMRILSSQDPKYSPGGYHYGTVWPLFTGWASIGEYRYHRPFPGYSNLRANALLTLNGSLGHVAEVLSGNYFQTLATGTPHQIWSAAMVVNPLLSGLLGLQVDATSCQLNFAPHIPADWSSFSVNNVRLGAVALNLNYQRTPDIIRLELQSAGTGRCSLQFSPALSLRAKITGVRLNGRALPFQIEANSSDQHVTVNVPITGNQNTIEIRMKNNFELSEASTLPALGSTSHGLRVLSESWSPKRDTLTLLLSGAAGENYELSAWNPDQISSIEGAALVQKAGTDAKVRVQLPASAPGIGPRATVIFHFAAK
jgi:glycogen debranching enzyme